MMFNAEKWAKEFSATYAATLSEKQHKEFIRKLTKLLEEAYKKGQEVV